jgi:hypothetical protein
MKDFVFPHGICGLPVQQETPPPPCRSANLLEPHCVHIVPWFCAYDVHTLLLCSNGLPQGRATTGAVALGMSGGNSSTLLLRIPQLDLARSSHTTVAHPATIPPRFSRSAMPKGMPFSETRPTPKTIGSQTVPFEMRVPY